MRAGRFILTGVLVAAGVAQCAYYYPQLPAMMASHFDAGGQANGWMSRQGYVAFMLGMMAFMAVLFPGVSWALARLPVGMINLPHREYWLAPERRAATFAFMARAMGWLSGAVLLLLLAINQLTIQGNLHGPPHLGAGAWVVLGGYLAFMVVWLTIFIRWFYRVPPEHSGQQGGTPHAPA